VLLNDYQIREAAEGGMIAPFSADQVREHGVSYGLSSFGYDIRLDCEFVFYGRSGEPLSPETVCEDDVTRLRADEYLLPPKGFVLAVTKEYLRLPASVTGLVCDKSSWARCGLHVQNTVLEAGWEGQVTLELTNNLPHRPIRLRAGCGIAQVLFARGRIPLTTYAERQGRYQHQTGVTLPRK
jgi:dCTP deaminase